MARLSFSFARRNLLWGAAALLYSACAQPASHPLTVDRAAYDAVAGLEAGAGPHAKSLAVSRWMQRHLRRSAFEAPAEPGQVLSAGRMDAVGAAALFRAMLESLGVRSRVMLAGGDDGAAWYPLVEVLDADGDHAWDALYGRYAADTDGTPLPVRRWRDAEDIRSTAGDLTAPAAQEPSLAALAASARPALRPDAAHVTFVSLRQDGDFGAPDATDADLTGDPDVGGAYGPALAAVGERATPFGAGTFGLRFDFPATPTGATVTLRYGLVHGSPRDLLIVAHGAALTRRDDGRRSLSFALETTTATVTLGAKTGRRVGFDYLSWSGL